MFGDYPATPYDINFRVLGFRVRIHPLFWVLSFIFSVPRNQGLPGSVVLGFLLVRTAAVFLSILVHELGHAIMIRREGFEPEIVLHGMGGYAIYTPYRPIRASRQIGISFAGPVAGFILYGLVRGLREILQNSGAFPSHPFVYEAFAVLEYINLWWGLVNLLPIYPLDGGQISRVWMQSRKGTPGLRNSLILSIATAAVAAFYFYSTNGRDLFDFTVLLFVYLGVSSWQEYSAMFGRRY